MRNHLRLLLILLACVLAFVYVLDYEGYFYPTTFIRKGVVVGDIDLSNKAWENGYNLLENRLKTPIYINLDNTSRAISLSEIGITANRNQLLKYTKTCRVGKFRMFCQNTSNENVDPYSVISIDNEKMTRYLDELEEQVQFYAQNTIISFDDFSFTKLTDDARIIIDKSAFSTKEGIFDLISDDMIKIQLKPKPLDNTENQHEVTKTLIGKITAPLLIKYGRTPIYIPMETLQKFIRTEEKSGYLYGIIEMEPIREYLDNLAKEYETEDVVILKEESARAIQRTLLYRAADYAINNAVILPLEGLPKTNGELHDVYLEVIKSQQRLYRFEHGELVKTYIVSTGLTWETPPGDYSVLGKQKMTISYFGNWYMPYYLPVGTVNGYRFGFHEIPYHMDAAGNIYSRDPNSMGSPATGGCIQLTKDDAIELFNWAKIGTPVYIYE